MLTTQNLQYNLEELEQMSDEVLIDLYRQGKTIAVDLLIQRYKKLVRMKLKVNVVTGTDKDDLIQEGMIGLFKAINDYDSSKEASFKTFATICITRQLATAFKTATRQKHMALNTSVSLDVPIRGSEEEESITLMDTLKNNEALSPEDEVIGQESLEVLNDHILKVLSKLEWQVLSLHLQGRDYREIAKEMGKTDKSIDNALQRIKKKLESVWQ